MSSAIRQHAQMNPMIRYFIPMEDISGVAILSGNSTKSLMTESDFLAATEYESYTDVSQGQLLKDLGRAVTIYDATTGAHLELWRLVQKVQGALTEGVDGDVTNGYYTFYIKVWDATGSVNLASRTG
jgi:hypothetical protein